jgi:hypothetical protein
MARVSFVVRNNSSASGSFIRYPDGSASPSIFPARTDYDSSLRADGLQLAAAATGSTSTFSATAITYGSIKLDWSVALSTVSIVTSATSLVIVYSDLGIPQTVASGTAIVSTISGVNTQMHTDLPTGGWAYYALFIHYTSTSGDDFYVKTAELQVLVPTDYGSTLTLWNQLPHAVKTSDIAQGDFNFNTDIGQTHGDKVGPLFKYLSIIGYDMDYMRTLVDYIMISNDPVSANNETLDALANLMNLPFTASQLGGRRLRNMLDNIGVYKRSKGTPSSINLMLGAVSGSNSSYNATTHKYSIQSQRANYITVPKTGTGLTTWRESYPGESTAGTALNLLRGAEFFIDAGRAVNAEQAALNQGTGGSALNARYGTGTGVDASDPLLLPHTGTNHLYLPGVNGNYVSIPDNPLLALTGNIEVVMRVALNDWTPTASQYLVGKWVGAKYSWSILVNITSGVFIFSWMPDAASSSSGTGGISVNTAPPTGLVDGTTVWLRCKFNVSNRQFSVEWAADSPTEPSSWGTVAATSTGASTSIFQTSAPLEIGSVDNGATSPLNGKVYRAILRNGFAGPTVVDVDFTTGLTSGNQVSVPFTGTALATSTPQYVSNLGTGGRALVARSGSLPNADGSDPLLLTHTGENYFYSTSSSVGAVGLNADNYAVIPDNGAMELLGSNGTNFLACTGGGARVEIPNDAVLGQFNLSTIEIVMRLQVDKLANTALTNDNLLITKGLGLGASGGFFLSLLGTGGISLGTELSATPGTPQYAIASGFSYPLGTPFWLKAVRYTSTGAVTFYQQPDQATEPTSWGTAANGTVGIVAGALGTNTSSLTIGAVSGSGGNVRLYRTIIRPAAPSTNPVLDLDFSSAEIGATVIPDQSRCKALATAAGGAKIVDGSTFLSLVGIDGNYATTPDNGTILDMPSSSVEIVFRIAADSYTPAVGGRIVSKLNGAGVPSGGGYEVYISGGVFNFQISNGTTNQGVSSSPHNASAGQPIWGRVTWTTGTGAYAFFWAADSPIEPTSWTAIGAGNTTVTTIADNAMDLRIGNMTGLSRPFAGKIYRVIVRNTTSGVTVFDADFSKQVELATTFNEGSSNNALVTVASTSNASKITSGTTFLSLHNTQASAYYASVPTNTAYDLAGDYEIVFRCTPSANVANAGLVVRDAAWRVLMDGTDASKIVLAHYATATNNWPVNAVSTTGAFVVGTTRWYKVTRASTGGSVSFYYAADQAYEPTTWTSASTGTIATAPETPGNRVQFGSRDNGVGNFSGRIYNVKV